MCKQMVVISLHIMGWFVALMLITGGVDVFQDALRSGGWWDYHLHLVLDALGTLFWIGAILVFYDWYQRRS